MIQGANQTETLAVALLSRSDTGLLALDDHLRVCLVNEAALRLLGAEPVDPAGTLLSLLDRASGLTRSGAASLLAWLQGTGAAEAVLRRHDGRMIAVDGTRGPEGHILLSLTLLPRSAVPASRRDALTGLADRAWFSERLGQMLAEPGLRPSVLLIDLHHFRTINDALGHAAGDALLQVVAKRLLHALREADVICRLAGDEFAVAMPQASDPEAVARRVLDALVRPYAVLGQTATLAASIGLARAPEHGAEPDALLRAARLALSAAKADGGAVRLYNPAESAAAERRHNWAEALRHAVAAHALELRYEPVRLLAEPAVSGFAALVHWRHPTEGLLPPEQFLPLAEHCGAAWPIFEWVLRTACEAATDWPPPLHVAVDAPLPLLRDAARLARTIKSALLRTALAPERLEIEVSEAALTGAEAVTGPALQAVAALGVRVTLDEVGTGAASVRQLAALPLAGLKLAPAMQDAPFVRAMVAAAGCLGLPVLTPVPGVAAAPALTCQTT